MSLSGAGPAGAGTRPPDWDEEAEGVLREAVELGVTLVDTAHAYGGGHNERLVGRALRGIRERVVLATKFGIVMTPEGDLAVDGSPATVRASVEESLRRLDTDRIDLLYAHRIDPDVPIEETVGSMADLVAQGTVRAIGLSEPSPETLRRAHAVHPIAAVQNEYSLATRDPEAGVLPVMRELGVTLVAYSPLGRGLLTGGLSTDATLADGDFRRQIPRFQGENLSANLALVSRLAEISGELGVTTGQLALAWLLAREDPVVPIPGTKSRSRLRENVAAADVVLPADAIARIEEAAPAGSVVGERLPESLLRMVGR